MCKPHFNLERYLILKYKFTGVFLETLLFTGDGGGGEETTEVRVIDRFFIFLIEEITSIND